MNYNYGIKIIYKDGSDLYIYGIGTTSLQAFEDCISANNINTYGMHSASVENLDNGLCVNLSLGSQGG